VLHAAIQLLLYALLAGLSPVAFAATIAVMPAGRLKVLGFGTAFVLAQSLTCSLFVIIGVVATGSSRTSHPGVHASLEIALAAVLVWLASRLRRRPPAAREGASPRTQVMIERLGRLRFLTTLLAGLLLGIGGPKRLVLRALAATTITTLRHRLLERGRAGRAVRRARDGARLGPVIFFVLLGARAVV
jgi:threonine/homoserine/homoserine lactone efflux protein